MTGSNAGCSPFDLKDYFLQELPASARVHVESHVNQCVACREELERLELTGAALFTVRDEEIPQRIAFVSDQIFEPSPVRRWFGGFWASTARLGFVSAAMLSASIFFFAATRPAPAPDRTAVVTTAAVSPSPQELQRDVQRQIDLAVSKAVAQVEARQLESTKQLVADFERRSSETLQSVRWMASELDANRKRAQVSRIMAMVPPGDGGEAR